MEISYFKDATRDLLEITRVATFINGYDEYYLNEHFTVDQLKIMEQKLRDVKDMVDSVYKDTRRVRLDKQHEAGK